MSQRIVAFGVTAVWAVLAFPPAVYPAINSNLSATADTSALPHQVDEANGVRDAVLGPVSLFDRGDDAFSVNNFSGTDGYFQFSSHGFSGPPLGDPNFAAGSASGSTHVLFQDAYTVNSGTLPFGTPVSFSVSFAAARRVTTIYNAGSFFSGNHASVSSGVTVNFAGQLVGGSLSQQKTHFDQNAPLNSTGLYAGATGSPTANVQGITVNTTVGAVLGFSMVADHSAGAAAFVTNSILSDAQASLRWGAAAAGSDATLISTHDNLTPFPGLSNVTESAVLGTLLPATIPEPASLLAMVIPVVMLRRRRQT